MRSLINNARALIFVVGMASIFSAVSYGQSASDVARKLEKLRAYPDVILENAKIYTMDPSLSQAQAMAIRENRIVALGTTAEM